MPKNFWQRGQALLLYVLLIPLLILVVGVGIDLGWYYLNVSRLQNAADAAALAGAQELVKKGRTMYKQDYYVDGLVFAPKDIENETKYHSFNVEADGTVVAEDIEIEAAKNEARFYTQKNLQEVGSTYNPNTTKIDDEWTKKKNISFNAMLYTRTIDWKNETTVYQDEASTAARYYKVELAEKINHMFLSGLEPMEAKVVACAIIMPHDKDLITTIEALRKEKTIANWEYQNYYKNFMGNWDHYQSSKIYYKTGNDYRYEKTNVAPDTAVFTSANHPAGTPNITYKETTDSINLDFRIDSVFSGTYNGIGDGNASQWTFDWDLRTELPEGVKRSHDSRYNDGWQAGENDNLRIISSFTFTGKWRDRNLDDLMPDILWTSIESDPMWFSMPFKGNAGMKGLNSVRQIVLNVKESNTEITTVTDKNNVSRKVYRYRPFFIIYLGPEVNNAESLNTIRQSQPVILNLYEDWNAILYMPNSPVIINGNNHKLTGFVIAKEYRRLKTIDEFPDTDYIKGDDDYNHKLIVPKDLAIYAGELCKLFDDSKEISTTEITINELLNGVSKYLIIESEYVKGLSGYTDDDYVAALMKYRNITDASKIVRVNFPTSYTYREGTGKTATIYNNTQSYAVVESDLLTDDPDPNANDKDDKYVPVITSNGDTKYIAKTNLPYVKVFRSGNYCYVPVCDVKLIDGTNAKEYHAGVVLVNDDTNTKLENTDTWRVHRGAMDNIYQPKHEKKKVYKIVDANNGKYFVFKSDVKTAPETFIKNQEAGRRKFSTADGKLYYVEESTESDTYYMQLIPDGSTEENPIIVDNLGDLQSVRITPEEILNVSEKSSVFDNTTTESRNNALMNSSDEIIRKYVNTYTRATYATENDDRERPLDWGEGSVNGFYVIDGEYRGRSNKRSKKDYRIPILERVYKNTTFNLSENLTLSYFKIPELERINYTYMNVDEVNKTPEGKWHVVDMFFTVKRASWID